MERKADQGQEEEEEAEGEEEYTYLTVEEDELEGNEEDIYAVVEGEEEEYEEDDDNEDLNSEQESSSILPKASKGDSQVLSQPKSDEKAAGLVGDARGQHGRPTDLKRAEEKTPNLATPFALDLKKDEGFLKTKPSEATKAELTAGIADSNSTTTNKLDKKTDGRHGETTGRQPPLLVGPVTLKYKEGFSISPSKGTSTPENAFKREARPLETNHGEMLENFSKAKEEATKRQDSEASFEEDLYIPSVPQSKTGTKRPEKGINDEWDFDTPDRKIAHEAPKLGPIRTNQFSVDRSDSNRSKPALVSKPTLSSKERDSTGKSPIGSLTKIEVPRPNTGSEFEWFDNNGQAADSRNSPKNQHLESSGDKFKPGAHISKLNSWKGDPKKSNGFFAGKITYRADLKPKLFSSKQGKLESILTPKKDQIVEGRVAENLNHSNSITNLGSKGSLTLGGKANTNGNIYIIDSLQNSTHNLKPYSKLATPKQSSKVIDSEPMRALPLIRSNSKTFASRENTPDTSKIVTSKPLMILNPNATPTYKEKKSFLQFGSLRGSKVGLSPLPADSLTGSKTKLRDLNDDLNAFQSVREPAVLKEVGQSKGGLDKPGFPTTKLTNKEKPALFSQSAVQSRRSSKVTPLPILGMHSIETKNPNMMSSKKVGPNFSSLNVSAIEKGSGRNSHKPNLIHDTSLTSKEIISSSQTKKKPSSSALLIDNLRKFLEWSESQSSKFSLGELEKTNKIASNLLAEGKETYLIAKLKHPDESIDSLDKSLTVNSYTKGTMNYLRMRYKKEDEANVVIMEALSDELSRLTKIQNNLRDPEYKKKLEIEVDQKKSKSQVLSSELQELRLEVKHMKEEVKVKERARVTPTEIAMLEKDFKNSALIKQFLKDDVKSMASKLGLAYQQQETMILKVNSLEQEAKASGLDNLELISLFDKLTAAVSNMKREIDMMQKDFSNRAQILERKVQDLKRVNETKTRSVEVISQEGQMISDNINHMKKFESNRELSLIHKIADAEKKKIAILTKDSKILIDESFNLGSNEPGTKTVGVGISSKSIQTPDSLRMLGNFAYD